MRWIVAILLAAAVGYVAYNVTGSSDLAYIARAIARGLAN